MKTVTNNNKQLFFHILSRIGVSLICVSIRKIQLRIYGIAGILDKQIKFQGPAQAKHENAGDCV